MPFLKGLGKVDPALSAYGFSQDLTACYDKPE